MRKKGRGKIATAINLMADFETRNTKEAIEEGKTWVWAWAICNIANIEEVYVNNDIFSFFHALRSIAREHVAPNVNCYFHNLKFDGKFIIDHLERMGYTWVPKSYKSVPKRMEYSTLIDDMGQFYQIQVNISQVYQNWALQVVDDHDNKADIIVTFMDSMKLIPGTVKSIGKSFNTKYQKLELDYGEAKNQPGDPLTSEQIAYIENDVKVVAEALQQMFADGTTKMTIGGQAIEEIKNTMGARLFKDRFPVPGDEEDRFIRKAYRGGFCYVNPDYANKVVGAGCVFDVNSEYPSVQSGLKGQGYVGGKLKVLQSVLPYQLGKYYEGKYPGGSGYPLYVQRFRVVCHLKPGYLPTVLIKHGIYSLVSNLYLTDSEPYHDLEHDMLELTLTSVDLELFLEHYEIEDIEWLDGYMYKGKRFMFDEFILPNIEIKNTSTGAKKQMAKLKVNNGYGKFAQDNNPTSKRPVMDGDHIRYVRYESPDTTGRRYIPMGAFITAYARRFIIGYAQKAYEQGTFLYCDTDSLHVLGPKADYWWIPQDDKALYAFKCESQFTRAIFIRPKTYIEQTGDNVYNLKCAGMNQASKDYFLSNYDFTDFKPGLKIVGKKLIPRDVEGGTVLVPTDFEIRA